MPTLESLRVNRFRAVREAKTLLPFIGFGDPVYAPPAVANITDSSLVSVGTSGVDSIATRSAQTIELRALAVSDQIELQFRTTDFSSREERSKILENLPPLPDTKDEILAIADALGATKRGFDSSGRRGQ